MSTKKLAFVDHLVLELQRIAAEHRLPYFVDDRHSTRIHSRPALTGHVGAGVSVRSTWVAAEYTSDEYGVQFDFLGYPRDRYELKPGRDADVADFLDAWEQRIRDRAESGQDDRPTDGDTE